MTPEAERRLREAILDRVADYKMWGLVVTGIVTRLNEDGPLQTLEHYAMSRETAWWPIILERRMPERSLEWLLVNDADARREAGAEPLRRARWKIQGADELPPGFRER